METAYLVPTFHHDIAYLKSEREYTSRCFEILDEALNILEDNPEYRFFLEQGWLLEAYWSARMEKRDRMRKYAREGRLLVEPGLYAVPDMSMPDGESIYMQATVGRKIAEECLGARPRVCMIADCWGHHAQLPQILSQCGYEYYAFSRCMRPDADRQNFIWRGADGSEIKAHWMSTHYDGVGFPAAGEIENAGELQWADAGEAGIDNLMRQNREKCGDDAQYLPVGGDMRFPSSAAPKLVKALNARGKCAQLEFAGPAEALSHVNWQSAPVFSGEFESAMQGTFSTNIWIKQMDRRGAREIYALEALSALLGAKKDFSLAWKLHLKNQFHDILCGTICNDAYRDVEADFRALFAILEDARRSLTGGRGEAAYFNPLPFARRFQTPFGALNVPALGFAPAREAKMPAPEALPALPCAFENEWYAAEIGRDGFVQSLIEKRTGAQLAGDARQEGARVPFGALTMQVDDGDSWWALSLPHLTRKTQAYTLNRPDPLSREDLRTCLPIVSEYRAIEADGDHLVILQKGEIRFWIARVEFETTITFSKSAPEIAYHTEFTSQSKRVRVRAAFPVNRLPRVRHQIPYALCERGAGEQAAQGFVDAEGEKAGLALINRGIPASNVEDGVMLLTLFRSTAMEYKCDSDLSYNLGRRFAFDYAVLPHAAGEDARLWEAALSFNAPCVPCPLPENPLSLGVSGAYISCLREMGDGLFLRLYNPFDEPRAARVVLPKGKARAAYADGLGEVVPGRDCETDGGEARVLLRARGVQGILLL